MEVYTKVEVDELIHEAITPLVRMIQELQSAIPDWVKLEEAQRLTGRSRSWFYEQRNAGTLPITLLPRTEGSRRTMYSRKDCLAYGIQHAILPPWFPGEPPQ